MAFKKQYSKQNYVNTAFVDNSSKPTLLAFLQKCPTVVGSHSLG